MASFVTATRLSSRLVSRRVAQDAASRGFRTSAASLAAQNFTMPALSPTMTEGNIATWKVKEGETFSAGDVLLEIETDKASMDVEAQEDGILMKIMQSDGSKGVQVGTRIGVIAEPGDDISQLEIPADEQSAQKKEAKTEEPQQSAAPEQTSQQPRQPRKSGEKAPPQKYPLYPSVAHLIKENKLDESAISEMTPTGPGGRLLKGDVLAYMGTISANRPEEIMKRFKHNSHLDLSNIKIAAPKEAPKKAEKAPAKKASVPEDVLVSRSVSFAKVLKAQKRVEEVYKTSIPLSTFLERAALVANDNLPLPSNYKPTASELFDEVLGNKPSGFPKVSQGRYRPQITALPPSSLTGVAPKPKSKIDIIDFLTTSNKKSIPVTKKASPSPSVISTGSNFISLKVPKVEEKRAQQFLAKMSTLLELQPDDLVKTYDLNWLPENKKALGLEI